MAEHLFVYGTLRRGCDNHAQLHSAPFLDGARTVQWCALYVDDYPYLNPKHGVCHVVGELYRVTPDILAQLDEFEGVPERYTRERIVVVTKGCARMEPWAYVRHDTTGRLLPHGDFLRDGPVPHPQ